MRLMVAFAALLSLLLTAAEPGQAQQQWRGGYFPNVQLTTQDGKKVRFYDDVLKGKVVAINFIYTSCPDVCPLDTAALRRVHHLIGKGMGRDVFFYSITVDPKHDTPAVLKRYMKTFDVGPGWTFLTGRPEDIALIQRKFGMKPTTAATLTAHDTRFVLGNETIARWVKRTPHDNPHVLAHILTRDMPGPRMARDTRARRSYANVTRVEGFTRGASLFMTRCSACHSIGGRDSQLGPDLAGVVDKRPRAWLARWIKEPDRVRAEKDPTAMALKARYREVTMPNLRLSDKDAADIIDYLDSETRAVNARKAHTTHAHDHGK